MHMSARELNSDEVYTPICSARGFPATAGADTMAKYIVPTQRHAPPAGRHLGICVKFPALVEMSEVHSFCAFSSPGRRTRQA